MAVLCAFAAGGLTVFAIKDLDDGDTVQAVLIAAVAALCLYGAVLA